MFASFRGLRDEMFDMLHQMDRMFGDSAFHDPFLLPGGATQAKSIEAKESKQGGQGKVLKSGEQGKEVVSAKLEDPWGWLHQTFRAPMDISESKEGFTVSVDLPGVKPDECKVEVKDGMLTVSGSRRKEFKEEKDTWRRVERSSGSFQRSIALPREVDSLF